MNITIPYYEDNTRISNSNIGWFLKKGPRYLKDMLDGNGEDLKLAQLEKGSMIHEYILQPDEFWKDYIILDFETPKTQQQKELLKYYSRAKLENPLSSEEDLLLTCYELVYTSNKSKERKIQEAKKIVEKYNNYLEYYKNKDSKKVISFANLQMLKQIKQNLQEHKKANELLFDYDKSFEVHNEFHINWEFPNASKFGDFPCKSLLDRTMIDHENKRIILIDIKTTVSVFNFKHSIEEYDYYRQLAYYWFALHWYFKNELDKDISEYKKETYIIAIQNNDNYEVRVFKIEPEDFKEPMITIEMAIKRIAWHKENDLWDHTKEYYEGDGTEEV